MQKNAQNGNVLPPAHKRPARSSGKSTQNNALRIVSRIGLVLLLLIPTYLSIVSYLLVKNAPEETIETYYTSLEIEGPTGAVIHVTPNAENEDAELFESFLLMLSDGTYTTGIPDTHQTNKYAVTMHTNTGSEQYTFHFSPTDESGAAYYIDAGGTIYRTADTRAEYFLNSPYAFELYPQSQPPVLTTAVTDKVVPSQLEWSYQTKDGTFANLTQVSVTDQILTYPIANDVSFKFSLPPTTCSLVIKNGNTSQRYESIDNISLPTLTQGTILEIEIDALYGQDSRFNYYGHAIYRFRMIVVEAASFSLDATVKSFGDYFLLTCQNVRNETELDITAVPALQNDPIVFKRNDTVYAAIPADAVCSDPANPRKLTVTYGSVSDTFDLTIRETYTSEDPQHNHTFDQTAFRGNWQELLNTLLSDKIRDKGATSESTLASVFNPNTAFGLPSTEATRHIAFGDRLTVTDSSVTDRTSLFELYEMNGQVRALAGGYAVETGQDELLGNYVIIDHGGGIYTWYCGLDDIPVKLKNLSSDYTPYVAEGETIGIAGQTGFGLSEKNSVMILATCGKTAISPQYLRDRAQTQAE